MMISPLTNCGARKCSAISEALGGALTTDVVPLLQCRVICGAANNQLARPEVADLLAAREKLKQQLDAQEANELLRFAGIVAFLFVVPNRADDVGDRAIRPRKRVGRSARLRRGVLGGRRYRERGGEHDGHCRADRPGETKYRSFVAGSRMSRHDRHRKQRMMRPAVAKAAGAASVIV